MRRLGLSLFIMNNHSQRTYNAARSIFLCITYRKLKRTRQMITPVSWNYYSWNIRYTCNVLNVITEKISQ